MFWSAFSRGGTCSRKSLRQANATWVTSALPLSILLFSSSPAPLNSKHSLIAMPTGSAMLGVPCGRAGKDLARLELLISWSGLIPVQLSQTHIPKS